MKNDVIDASAREIRERCRAPWLGGLAALAPWSGVLAAWLGADYPSPPTVTVLIVFSAAVTVRIIRVFSSGPDGVRWLTAPSVWMESIVVGIFSGRRPLLVVVVIGFVVNVAIPWLRA